MDIKLSEALQSVETSYKDLVEIANNMLEPIISPCNAIVNEVNNNVNNLSIEQIRDYILKIQLAAYQIAEVKEKSAFKADLAEAIQKEKFAISFNGLDGSAAAKEKLALVENSPEIVSNALYNLTSNLLKTKLDSLYRMVDSLKSVLMSRMQEAKFMQLGSSSEIPQTYGQQYKNPQNFEM